MRVRAGDDTLHRTLCKLLRPYFNHNFTINNEVNNLYFIFVLVFVLIHLSDITNTFLLIYQLGACCIYVVFVASNIKDIADYCLDDNIDVRLFMLIILLPLILINWVRKSRPFFVHFVNNWNAIYSLFNGNFIESLSFSLDSKLEIFGAFFNNSECHNNYIIWNYLLLYVP